MSLSQETVLHLQSSQGPVNVDIAAAVFDCDGLLVDSESTWLDLLRQWLSEWGQDPDQAELFLGLSVQDTGERLAQLIGPEGADGEAVATEIADRYSVLLASGIQPMPGAVEVFTALARQLPVAVASNGLRRDVEALLENCELLPLASAVCTVEDVRLSKPAPDLYLHACAQLQVDPGQAVAFEDSPAGAQAAIDAGLIVVGVNADETIQLPCTYRLTSLEFATFMTTKDHN